MPVQTDFDIFAEPTSEVRCTCGQGFCQAHGTFHFSDSVEELDRYRRETKDRGTRGGRRVRKKKGEESR
jgi:hypothetical protein